MATENYTALFSRFNFLLYFWNSTFITVVATILTVLFNSMAAFALSKYKFRGRTVVFLLIIATLMIPPTINLVPIFLVVSQLGLVNSPWGVIWPAIATPTGVFLLRQYMLTIPDDLLDAARMDHASRMARLLAHRHAAVGAGAGGAGDLLGDVALERLPLAADRPEPGASSSPSSSRSNSFQGELQTQWSNLLAMTVLTLLPITIVFAFLQKYITQGIAQAGVK